MQKKLEKVRCGYGLKALWEDFATWEGHRRRNGELALPGLGQGEQSVARGEAGAAWRHGHQQARGSEGLLKPGRRDGATGVGRPPWSLRVGWLTVCLMLS